MDIFGSQLVFVIEPKVVLIAIFYIIWFNTNIMRISKIDSITNKQNPQTQQPKKREFIDIIADNVRNPRDVEDCVAVPRGIFKAYIYLMIGSSLMLSAAALPQKWKTTKTILNIASAIFSATSAVYFAKPFAVKGLSPTVNREDYQN